MTPGEIGGYNPEQKKLSPRDRLIQSGIAERMLESITKPKHIESLDPGVTFGVKDCDFRVVQFKDENDEVRTQIIIEMPNLRPENNKKEPRIIRAFAVKEGKKFGGDRKLNEEQYALVQTLLKEQAENQNERAEK